MRVLFYSDYFPPQTHGISVRCSEWLKTLQKNCTIKIMSSEPWNKESILCRSSYLRHAPDVRISSKTGLKEWKKIKDFKPDLIHIVSPSSIEVCQFLYLYSTYYQIPIVTSHHASVNQYLAQYYHSSKFLEKTFFRIINLNVYLIPSYFSQIIAGPTLDSLKLFQKKAKLEPKKMKVFSTGINQTIFSYEKNQESETFKIRSKIENKFEEKFDLKPSFLVLYAGRLAKEKNIEQFLSVAKKRPKVGFVLCGFGPQEKEYQALVKKEKLKNILFLGKQTQDCLAYYYASCDLMINPSITETYGFTSLEAITMGLPVLMPEVPVFKEIYKNFPDFLVSLSKNQEKITQNYCTKLDQHLSLSKEERSKRKTLLREYSQKFSWEKSSLDLINIYKEALKKKTFQKRKAFLATLLYIFSTPIIRLAYKILFFPLTNRAQKRTKDISIPRRSS